MEHSPLHERFSWVMFSIPRSTNCERMVFLMHVLSFRIVLIVLSEQWTICDGSWIGIRNSVSLMTVARASAYLLPVSSTSLASTPQFMTTSTSSTWIPSPNATVGTVSLISPAGKSFSIRCKLQSSVLQVWYLLLERVSVFAANCSHLSYKSDISCWKEFQYSLQTAVICLTILISC